MEVDRGIVARRVAPAHLAPAPLRADDAARGHVDQPAVPALRPRIGDRLAADAVGKIPRRQHQS